MSNEFTFGQPVRIRRSEVEKFQNGWYLEKTHPSGHLVHIDGAGPGYIPEDMIQPRHNDVILTGHAFVFKRRAGGFTVIAQNDSSKQHIMDSYKDFAGYQLVGLIDLAKFDIAFPEGEGLLPDRYTS